MLWDRASLPHTRSSNSHLENHFLQKRPRKAGLKMLLLFSLLSPVYSTILQSIHFLYSVELPHKLPKASSHWLASPTWPSGLPLPWQHESSSFSHTSPFERAFLPHFKAWFTCKNLCFFGLTAGGRDCCLLHPSCFPASALFIPVFLNSASPLRVCNKSLLHKKYEAPPHAGLAVWN